MSNLPEPDPIERLWQVLTSFELTYIEYGSGTCRIDSNEAKELTDQILLALDIKPMTPADARNPYKFHDAARYSAGYNDARKEILGDFPPGI